MSDLNGLDWSSKQSNNQKTSSNYSAFNTLRPTPPGSGRVSPLPATSSPLNPAAKPSTPANDSFSNLVSFSSNTANKNLSLQDQQKRLADLKSQQHSGAARGQNQFAAVDDSVWNSLGSGRSTPAAPASTKAQLSQPEDEDDLFAVFNAPQSVPKPGSSKAAPPATALQDDDDPFGLSEFQAKSSQPRAEPARKAVQEESLDDDDVLGLLGRPASEFAQPRKPSPEPDTSSMHPQEKAVAELVDMGFPADKAQRALETTDSGLDVQAAVGWLLTQAHAEASDRSRNASGTRNGMESRPARSRPPQDDPVMPPRREKTSTPSNDAAQIAGEFGTAFLKTAGSLWKTSQKKIQQAVQEFNSEGESSQPKWMREASPAPQSTSRPQRREDAPPEPSRQRRERPEPQQNGSVTDEALMLETQRPEKPPRPSQKVRAEARLDSSRDTSRDHSPAMPSRLRENNIPQAAPTQVRQGTPPARASLSRQAAEEQASQAYKSSARRRKPAPQPTQESNLLEETSRAPTAPQRAPVRAPSPQTAAPPRPVKSTPIQVRPAAPVRNIPAVSSISLKASHADREAGNQHFKRGDYSSAHQSYSKSLSHLPSSHPITIILLTNRALTAIKTGEPKIAVADSDTVIALIGPSKGESETVDLANGDTPKPMREYYGKALMRKAEALENMERWAEAAAVWREAVESGHGGSTAIQSRQRAENAAKPKPAVANTRKPTPAKPAGKSAAALRAGAQAEKAALDKLRAQNAAAERADDERFQLSDSVDARIHTWRGGKQDNLRALLGSLDTVLWPDSGWKKISMADLVLPNKVKIQYMKGIAKVHPDKIPTTATTEQRMIAGSVFSTLNEAWDKFKKENNL